ncbi:hypothetical protein H6G32_09280 [Cylindrospermum sp. FACHB-282]|nr:hypothetical protein [Cylindrospermum sp. FACHB-282]
MMETINQSNNLVILTIENSSVFKVTLSLRHSLPEDGYLLPIKNHQIPILPLEHNSVFFIGIDNDLITQINSSNKYTTKSISSAFPVWQIIRKYD